MKNILLFRKPKGLLFLSFALFFLLVSVKGYGQVTVFNYQNTTATIPAGWTLTNNVTTNAIDRTTYLLLDAGNPGDQIVTPNYNLTGYTGVALVCSVATFGTINGNPALRVEVSTDGGTSWSATTYTSSAPTSSTYVNSTLNITGQTFTSTTKFRFSNTLTTGTGLRNQSLKLTGTPGASAPGAPTIGTITPGNGQLSVAFTAPSSNGGAAITDYKCSINGGTYFSLATTTSPFVLSTLTNGTAYSITIKAVNSAGDGTASNSVSGTPSTVPSASTITGITPGNGNLSIAFTSGSDGGAAVTNYKYSLNGGGSFTAFSPAQTTSPVSISGLTNGTAYNVQLVAVNTAGDGTASNSETATPFTTPSAVTGFTVTEENSQLSLAFTAGADGGSAITNYEYSLNGGSTFTSAGATTSPIVVTGLTNGTVYSVQLRAINAAGNGVPTTSLYAIPRTISDAPSITGITAGNSQLSVAFTAPVFNGGATITNYKYSLNGGLTFVSAGTTSSPILITGLTNGTTYDVQLLAVNVAGDGTPSSSVQGTPEVPSAPTITASKTSLNALSTIYGTASATDDFNVSGATLSGDITVTAPTGFEVSTSSASGYASSITVGGAGSVSSTPIYVRLAATNAVGIYSGNIILDSPGAAQVTVATANSSVAQKELTIIGLTGVDKTYDGTTVATVTGTPSLVGVVGSDDVTVNDTSVNYNFDTATAGIAKAITAAGFSLSGSTATNYTISQPIGIMATINKAASFIYVTGSTMGNTYIFTYNGSVQGPNTSYVEGSTGAVTYSYTGITPVVAASGTPPTNAGTYTVTATVAADTNYETATSADFSFTIDKAEQTITLASTDAKTTSTTTYSLIQNASSGLAIVYTSSNAAVATVSGNTVTIVGIGSTTITANQVGDTNYNAAPQITQELTVSQGVSVLAGWDFFGQSSPATFAATTYNSSLSNTATQSTMRRGSNAISSSGSNSFRTTGFQNNGISTSNTDYFEVKATPVSGKTLTLTRIDANLIGTATFVASPGVTSQFAYSLNGTTFTLIGSPVTTTSLAINFDLSSVTALQNVPSGTTVTLRYYASGQTATGGWGFSSPTSGTNGLALTGYIQSLPAPSITSTLTANGIVGTAFTYATTATNLPTSYSATGLPSGLSINTTSGVISGTPTVAGNFNVSLSATNETGTDTKTLVINVGQANQVITFNTLSGKTYGDASFSLNGTSTSGLALTYSSSNTAVATISGNTVTIVGVGTTSITASQSGDANYFAASDISQDLVVAKANQTITFNTLSDKNDTDGSFNLDATASSGLSVSYSSSNTSVVTISGTTATIVAPGITIITASQAGNDNYNAATSVDQSQTIINTTLTNQTITFGPLSPVTYGDGTFTLNGTVDSSLAITYVSSNPSVASVSGDVVTVLSPGTTTITASQAGDSAYNPAPNVSQSLVVNTKTLTISNIVVANKDYDGTDVATITSADLNGVVGADDVTLTNTATFASANAGSGIAVTPNFVLNGVDASRYNLTQPTGLVANINMANQTILFDALSSKSYGDLAFNLIATGGASGLPVTFTSSDTNILTISGNVATIIGVGNVTITASQAGDTNYNAASDVLQTITINKANQIITFNALVNRTTADTSFTLGGFASSGLPLSYASSNAAVASVSGNVVTIVGPGSTTITVSQAGNDLYNAATDVNQTQIVLTAISKWTFENITTTNSGRDVVITGSALADQGVQTVGTLFSANHASSSTSWTNLTGNGSLKSVSSNNWAVGDYWQFKVNTLNYNNLAVSVEQTGSGTGPSTFKLQYSLNGTSYTDLPGGTYSLDTGSWSSALYKSTAVRSFDLSSLISLNNKSEVYVRLVNVNTTSNGSGIVSTGGTSRIDNFVITGVACNSTAGITNNTNTNILTCDTEIIALTAIGGTSYSWSNGTNVVGTSENLSVTAAGTYTVTVSTDNGCSSTSAVVITENKTTTSEEIATACDTYTWNGSTYTTSGDYTFSSTNASGCTNTATLHLTINNSSTSVESVIACDSYTWSVNGATYTTGGTYTGTSTNAANCPQTETLNLTINTSTSNTTNATACDTYTWSVNGATYTVGGTYTGTSTNAANCPQAETLNLTINASTSNTITATACDTYTWSVNGATYTTSGQRTVINTNSANCPQTETLNLTINASTSNTTTATACDTYTWSVNGATYTTSGQRTVTSTNAANCPQTETLNLTITPSTTGTTTVSACDTYTWSAGNGNTYTSTPTSAPTFVSGCNTQTLALTITPSTTNTTEITACESYFWPVTELTYTDSDEITETVGCVTETLVLTINYSTSNTTTITQCGGSYTWEGPLGNDETYSASTTVTNVTTNAEGCDHTETLVLTIIPSTSNTTTLTVNAASYIWSVNGQTYTASGTYTSVSGCHTEILELTLIVCSNTTSSQSVTACDSYTWSINGQTYNASGTFTFVSSITGGCTDTKTLNLTINQSTTSSVTQSACGSYSWSVNGESYSTSGTYTSTGTNADGCLDTKILVLTITPVVTNTTIVTQCDSYTWPVNNQSYTASGNFSVTTACGTEYLELTINNSTSNTTTVSACNSYTWSGPLGNGQTYTTSQSGVTNTSTNAAGCTHTETLNLTINGITAQPVGPKLCTTAGSTASVSVTTNVTSPLYTWQFRVVTATSTGAWTTITSANAGTVYTNITSSTLGITRTTLPAVGTQYRVLISNSDCSLLTSDIVSLTIDPLPVVKTITGNTPNLCSGGSRTLILGVASVGSIQWQRNVTSSATAPLATDANWSDLGSFIAPTAATNAANSLDLTNVTETAWYRVKFTSGTCTNVLYSVAVRLGVDPTAVVGTVSVSTPEVCSGSSATLTLSNNVGVISWQKSTNYDSNNPTAATWAAVTGATASVSTGALTVKTWFRAEVTSGTCGTVRSNIVEVSVSPKVVVKTITGNTPNVCFGGDRTLTLGLASVGSIQWQRNVTTSATAPLAADTNWSDLGSVIAPTGATNAATPLALTNLTETAWYRVKFTSGSCAVGYSVAVRLGVDPTAVVGTVSVSTPEVCSGSSATLTLSNNVGVISWQKSTNYDSNNPTAATWAAVTGATASVSTGALTVKTWFRARTTSGVCAIAVSNVVEVSVSPKVVVKTISGNTPNVCFGGSRTLTLATASVGSIQWQRNVTSSATAPLAADANWSDLGSVIAPTGATNAATPLALTNLTETAWYRVKFTSGSCAVGYSVAVRLGVDPIAVVGTVSVSASQVCSGLSATLSLSTPNVGVISWQKSTNYDSNNPTAATWAAVTGATASVSTGALTARTWFRARTTSGVCAIAASNVVEVNVSPKPVSKAITASITTPSGATSALALCRDFRTAKMFTIGAGYVGSIQWQTVASATAPTATAVWTDIVGANGSTYTVGDNGFVPAVGGNYFRVRFSSSPCSPDVFSASLVVWYKDCAVVRDVTPIDAVTTVKTPFSVKAYPNPYTETFNLSLTTSSEDKVSVVVYDMTGRLIERRDVRPSDMVEQQIGDRYPSGIYNVVVTQGEEVKTVRVIKR